MNIDHQNNLISFMAGIVAGFKYSGNSWGWSDLKGTYVAPATGGTAPTSENFDGDVDLGFNASDTITWRLHREHSGVVGGNKYMHAHIGKALATVASGSNLVISMLINHRYHNLLGSGEALRTGDVASVTKTLTITPAELNSNGNNTWVVEVLYAQSGGGVGLINSDSMLPDDDVTVTCTITSFPTMNGGTSEKIRFSHLDEHTEVTIGGTLRRFFTSLSFN